MIGVETWVGRMMFSQIRFSLALIIVALGSIQHAHAQGVATGGSAVPARPLRAGMKPPRVEYHDIAAQAGLTGVDVSGSETSKKLTPTDPDIDKAIRIAQATKLGQQ